MNAGTISASCVGASPAPFDAVADGYDRSFTTSVIGTAQRRQVWLELDRVFRPGQQILEINCGTGVDAVHLASRGIEIWACDSSPRMIDVASRRVESSGLSGRVRLQVVPTEQIHSLRPRRPFDGAFSNFGGLNCVGNLRVVAERLARVLAPGSPAVLCIMGRYVAWEMVWFALRGRPREAVRRLGKQPVEVSLAGQPVSCWYRSVRELRRSFQPWFQLRRWRGVGVSIPPSYLERQAQRFPRVMRTLESADSRVGRTPLLRGLADHLLLTLERC